MISHWNKNNQKQPPEVFCKISQNSLENICGRDSFFKKKTFCEICKNTFLQNTSEWLLLKNTLKFIPDSSEMKKFMKSNFSELIRKINLIYLLWKVNFLKSTSNSTVCFITIPRAKKTNQVLQWHRCQQNCILFCPWKSTWCGFWSLRSDEKSIGF